MEEINIQTGLPEGRSVLIKKIEIEQQDYFSFVQFKTSPYHSKKDFKILKSGNLTFSGVTENIGD